MGKFKGTFRDRPWLGEDTIVKLDEILRKDSHVLECGAGASTLWMASRVESIMSFEHKIDWAQAVEQELFERNYENVKVIYDINYPLDGIKIKYMKSCFFDVVIIDGRGRVKGVETGFPLVVEGGYLILDNSNRARYQQANDLMTALKWECEIIQSLILPKNTKGYTTFWRRPI